MAFRLTRAGSYSTAAVPVARLTVAFSTPGSSFSACALWMTRVAQVIPAMRRFIFFLRPCFIVVTIAASLGLVRPRLNQDDPPRNAGRISALVGSLVTVSGHALPGVLDIFFRISLEGSLAAGGAEIVGLALVL